MRRLVVALFVAFVAFALVGCGGGGGAEEPADTEAAQVQAPAAPAAADETPIDDRSATTSETFEPFPAGEAVPTSVADRLAEGEPMLLFFFNDDQRASNDVRTEVNRAMADNRGKIDLLSYDLGKYTSIDASGTIEADEDDLDADEKAQEAVRLARALGVDGTPYVAIVDDQGYLIFHSRGYIDQELLNRQIERVSE